MAKATIYLDTRRIIKKSLKYPIKIRVTNVKERKYYKTGYEASQSQFDLLMNLNENPRGTNKTIRGMLLKILKKANDSIDNLTQFSFTAFEDLFLSKKSTLHILEAMSNYEDEVRNEGRISTANSYKNAADSFRNFLKQNHKKKNNPTYGDINKIWLEEYESYMRSNNASWSTIGIYLRNLRRIFNRARKTTVIPNEYYPFGKDSYIIPSSVNIKKALTYEQVNQIFHYDCSNKNDQNKQYDLRGSLESMEKWRDFWILSYLCSGVNFKDIAAWKWKDLENNRIRFVRQKTRRSTKGQLKKIEIVLSDVALNIINRYCNKDRTSENYIFPFYTDKMDADKKLRVSNQQIKNINTWIGRIAKILEFEFKPTYQSARHSFATISRNAGVDKEYIQKSLGHQDGKTTDNYLDSFEADKIKENQSVLLDTNAKRYLKVV